MLEIPECRIGMNDLQSSSSSIDRWGCEGRPETKLTFLLTRFLLVHQESGPSTESPEQMSAHLSKQVAGRVQNLIWRAPTPMILKGEIKDFLGSRARLTQTALTEHYWIKIRRGQALEMLITLLRREAKCNQQ